VTATLVDTGFLVAAFSNRDRFKASAKAYLVNHRPDLITVAPVIVETCFFLDAQEKRNLLEWAQRGGLEVAEWPVSAYSQVNAIITKYADRDIDLADATLIWLAAKTGTQAILTIDIKDFSVYRLTGSKRFDVIDWHL
jgi:uncharacterized protein